MGRRRRKGLDVNGWLALDKPAGLTSTQALGQVKRLFTPKKAGHAGTLDPLATGVLPIAFGEATKTVARVVDGAKCYRFLVCWGRETSTDDREGQPTQTSDLRPARPQIEALLPRFTGEIAQVPPQFSAIKVDGMRAYDLAREGETLALAARPVRIDRLDIIEHDAQAGTTTFEALCGKGTYVRALARDMGRALGCFGHVGELRRTRVGPFYERDTISLDKLQQLRHSADLEALTRVLQPVEFALDDIPAYEVSKADAARLRRGQAVLIRGPLVTASHPDAPGPGPQQGEVCAMSGGTLVALGEIRQGALHPSRVFHL